MDILSIFAISSITVVCFRGKFYQKSMEESAAKKEEKKIREAVQLLNDHYAQLEQG